ncbi:MAG: AbrB/MazE/SpoVT family DNA-binding domain-containing protein [Planctomycetota bacterium]
MKITSKGQVTIPQEIRERVGLLPNTDVEFKISGKRVFLQKSPKTKSRGRKLIEKLTGAGSVALSTDQIMALTRGE